MSITIQEMRPHMDKFSKQSIPVVNQSELKMELCRARRSDLQFRPDTSFPHTHLIALFIKRPLHMFPKEVI
jgi:hypothetical protein